MKSHNAKENHIGSVVSEILQILTALYNRIYELTIRAMIAMTASTAEYQ